jgi:hypothetical protein
LLSLTPPTPTPLSPNTQGLTYVKSTGHFIAVQEIVDTVKHGLMPYTVEVEIKENDMGYKVRGQGSVGDPVDRAGGRHQGTETGLMTRATRWGTRRYKGPTAGRTAGWAHLVKHLQSSHAPSPVTRLHTRYMMCTNADMVAWGAG